MVRFADEKGMLVQNHTNLTPFLLWVVDREGPFVLTKFETAYQTNKELSNKSLEINHIFAQHQMQKSGFLVKSGGGRGKP